MKSLLISVLMLPSLLFATGNEGPIRTQAGLEFSKTDAPEIFRRKKKKVKPLGIGLVAGQPTGFGARVIFQPSRFAVSGDFGFKNVRSDSGLKVGVGVIKVDARYYADGIFGALLRPYVFGGLTMLTGKFELGRESQMNLDAGVGAGIRLGKIGIDAEAGLMAPAYQPESYTTGVRGFTNISVIFWPIVIEKDLTKRNAREKRKREKARERRKAERRG